MSAKRRGYGEGLTPRSILDRRCLDAFWVATHRDRARGALNDARRALLEADWAFDDAARWLVDGLPEDALYSLGRAFARLDDVRWHRKQAKRAALMAVRGRDLESWVGRDKNSERRSSLIVHGCVWESTEPRSIVVA